MPQPLAKVSPVLNKATLSYCKELLKNSLMEKMHNFPLKRFSFQEYRTYLRTTPLYYSFEPSPSGPCLGIGTQEGLSALEFLGSLKEAELFLKEYQQKYEVKGDRAGRAR